VIEPSMYSEYGSIGFVLKVQSQLITGCFIIIGNLASCQASILKRIS